MGPGAGAQALFCRPAGFFAAILLLSACGGGGDPVLPPLDLAACDDSVDLNTPEGRELCSHLIDGSQQAREEDQRRRTEIICAELALQGHSVCPAWVTAGAGSQTQPGSGPSGDSSQDPTYDDDGYRVDDDGNPLSADGRALTANPDGTFSFTDDPAGVLTDRNGNPIKAVVVYPDDMLTPINPQMPEPRDAADEEIILNAMGYRIDSNDEPLSLDGQMLTDNMDGTFTNPSGTLVDRNGRSLMVVHIVPATLFDPRMPQRLPPQDSNGRDVFLDSSGYRVDSNGNLLALDGRALTLHADGAYRDGTAPTIPLDRNGNVLTRQGDGSFQDSNGMAVDPTMPMVMRLQDADGNDIILNAMGYRIDSNDEPLSLDGRMLTDNMDGSWTLDGALVDRNGKRVAKVADMIGAFISTEMPQNLRPQDSAGLDVLFDSNGYRVDSSGNPLSSDGRMLTLHTDGSYRVSGDAVTPLDRNGNVLTRQGNGYLDSNSMAVNPVMPAVVRPQDANGNDIILDERGYRINGSGNPLALDGRTLTANRDGTWRDSANPNVPLDRNGQRITVAPAMPQMRPPQDNNGMDVFFDTNGYRVDSTGNPLARDGRALTLNADGAYRDGTNPTTPIDRNGNTVTRQMDGSYQDSDGAAVDPTMPGVLRPQDANGNDIILNADGYRVDSSGSPLALDGRILTLHADGSYRAGGDMDTPLDRNGDTLTRSYTYDASGFILPTMPPEMRTRDINGNEVILDADGYRIDADGHALARDGRMLTLHADGTYRDAADPQVPLDRNGDEVEHSGDYVPLTAAHDADAVDPANPPPPRRICIPPRLSCNLADAGDFVQRAELQEWGYIVDAAAVSSDPGDRVIRSPYSGMGASAFWLQVLDDTDSLVLAEGELRDLNVIIVLPAGSTGTLQTGSHPDLHQDHTRRLDSANYVIVVTGIEADPSPNGYVRLGRTHSEQRALPCGWAAPFCVSANWREEQPALQSGIRPLIVGSAVPTFRVWLGLRDVWLLRREWTRRQVLSFYFENCTSPAEPGGTGTSMIHGRGIAEQPSTCAAKVIEGLVRERDMQTMDPSSSLALADGNLELAGAALHWQALGLGPSGRFFQVPKAARSGTISAHLDGMAPQYGRPGQLSWRWVDAPTRLRNAQRNLQDGRDAALHWTAGRNLWGLSAPGFDMAGGQWQLAADWRLWVGLGAERGTFATSRGSGSWQFADTDQLQLALDSRWHFAAGWTLEAGAALAHFEHRPGVASLVGPGTGRMAEVWLKLRQDRFSVGLQVNSGLHGELQLQQRSWQLAPVQQTSLDFDWRF